MSNLTRHCRSLKEAELGQNPLLAGCSWVQLFMAKREYTKGSFCINLTKVLLSPLEGGDLGMTEFLLGCYAEK